MSLIRRSDEELDLEQDEPDEQEFTSCGGGWAAMRSGCDCDGCTNAGDDEYHRRKEDGYY